MNPFNILLIREPSGPALQRLPTASPFDASQNNAGNVRRLDILHQLSLMCTKTDEIQCSTVPVQKILKLVDSTYIKARPRWRHLQKGVSPFQISAVTSHTITMNEEGLSNDIISVDWATQAPCAENASSVNHSVHDVQSANTPLDSTPEGTKAKIITAQSLHVVHGKLHITTICTLSIISLIIWTKNRIRYKIHCLGYDALDDTAEASENIPEHLKIPRKASHRIVFRQCAQAPDRQRL